MKEVKRWVSPYAAGTESYKALQVVCDRAEPDPDEGPFFVLASDFDSIVKELEGKLKTYGKHLDRCDRNTQMPMVAGRMYTWPHDTNAWLATRKCTCGLDEALAQIEGK